MESVGNSVDVREDTIGNKLLVLDPVFAVPAEENAYVSLRSQVRKNAGTIRTSSRTPRHRASHGE